MNYSGFAGYKNRVDARMMYNQRYDSDSILIKLISVAALFCGQKYFSVLLIDHILADIRENRL
jgi:hypothetical protein